MILTKIQKIEMKTIHEVKFVKMKKNNQSLNCNKVHLSVVIMSNGLKAWGSTENRQKKIEGFYFS